MDSASSGKLFSFSDESTLGSLLHMQGWIWVVMGGATVGLVVAMVVVVVVSVTRGNQNQNKKPCSTIKKTTIITMET